MDQLITSLEAIGTSPCGAAASRLHTAGTASFDLYLRNARLNAQDAINLVDAIGQMKHGPVLRSFSASYNPDLTDAGVVALADAFPTTMTELGLVRLCDR